MPHLPSLMTDGFMPHGYCLRWDMPLIIAFIAGNAGIALAYFLIPAALRFFVGRRRDLPYPYMFSLFAAFILSCGLTHLAKIWTLYQPVYWLEAGIDLFTAVVSLLTAFLLIPLIPRALKLRSPAELDEANKKLAEANSELDASKSALEKMVKEREHDLEQAIDRAATSELEFKQLFDLMPELGWTARPDGYIDFYNERWYEFTGTTFEQMHGWGWESVHDPAMVESVKERWKRSLAASTPFEMEFPLRRADGVYNTFLTRIKPIMQDGKTLRWVGINTNIQEQKDLLAESEKNEQRFRLLADALPDLVWTVDRDLQVTYLNARWYEYTGMKPPAGLGEGWKSTLHPDSLESALKDWQISIAEKQPYEGEQLLRGKDGEYRWFLVRGLPVLDDENNITSWFGTCTDIHFKKQARDELERLVSERTAQLQQALDNALVANRVKSQFVSTVSHEVRTPMSGVIGLAELLSVDPKLDQESKVLATEIYRSSTRLLSTLNDILDFSKLESGKVQLEFQLFSPGQLLEDVIASLPPAIKQKSIEVRAVVDENLPATICGDELRVRQVLLNFASNACKFTDQGSITIAAKLLESRENSVTVKFSVEDTGIGIDELVQKQIFEPFTQADSSITRRFGGTGLGLAISKNYVTLMGGQIGMESAVGKGSNFWFTVEFPTGESSPCQN